MTGAVGGRSELARLVDSCVVRVPQGDVRGGSGFLAAPGLVLTCAHVVSRRAASGYETAAEVEIHWDGETYRGSVRAVPDRDPGDGLWAFPDLALIEVELLPDGHPYAWLSGELPRDPSTLYATGFKDTYGQGQLGGVWAEYDGPHDVFGRPMLNLAKRELASGMSGGPIMDPVRGAVCGILTTSRRPGQDLGGLGTPMAPVFGRFPELRDRFPQHPEWRRLRNEAEMLAEGMPEGVREELAAMRFSVQELHELFDRIFGGLRPPPDRPLESMDDLIGEAADSPLPEAGRPSPLELLRREATSLTAGRAEPESARSAPPRVARIETRLTPAGGDMRKLLMEVWVHRDLNGPPSMVFSADECWTLAEIRERIRPVLKKALRTLAPEPGAAANEFLIDDVVLEFVLPFELLGGEDEAVDEWYLDKSFKALGTQFPVVVRTGDRPPDTVLHLHRRWRALSGREPLMRWVECGGSEPLGRLYASFQNSADNTVLMIPSPPRDPAGRSVLEAAYEAGLPAAIWRRRACPVHANGPATAEDGCTGGGFRDALTAWFSDRSAAELPRLVRALRAEAQEAGIPGEHCGEGLTLLWDDPTRPDPGAAAFSAPRAARA